MRIQRFLAPLAISLLLASPVRGAAEEARDPFPFPETLRPAVDFWRDVFTSYDSDQVVYFDAMDVGRVYEVRRLPTPDGTRSRERERSRLREAYKEALREELERLADPDTDFDALDGRLRRLTTIWDGSRDPEVYRAAAENLRSQRGIRESFLAGVTRSARYIDRFREIFREEGAPEDLVYLPHVESSYRWDARSGVGAVGMWQFMSYTGKKWLRIDRSVDERLDPYESARAAARYLLEAHEEVGSWPLTVTSYNQGVSAMVDARLTLGTDDIERVIREYRGPRFGFMGRNFYAEFLAAREEARRLLADPGDLELEEPVPFEAFELPAYVKLSKVVDAFEVSPVDLRELNPALSADVRRDRDYLPRGYTLKLPSGLGAEAPELWASIPAEHRHAKKPILTYRVRGGDTLGGIANRFRTTVRTLQDLNGIRNPNRLRVGQVLRLPGT